MKKTIWITGTLLAIGIAVILMYFSFSQGKDSSTTPEGTFVKEVGDEMKFKADFTKKGIFVKVESDEMGFQAAFVPEGRFVKGAEIEWRQSA